MTMDWFRLSRVTIGDLELFGVTMREPNGQPVAFIDGDTGRTMVAVGSICKYADGRIMIWPRVGIDGRANAALLTNAEEALRDRITSWAERTSPGGERWLQSPVFVAVQDGHILSEALRAVVAQPHLHNRERDRRQAEVADLIAGDDAA